MVASTGVAGRRFGRVRVSRMANASRLTWQILSCRRVLRLVRRMRRLIFIGSHFFRNEFEDMLEIPWLGNTIVVATIGKSAPEFAVRVADSIELSHIRRAAQVSMMFLSTHRN